MRTRIHKTNYDPERFRGEGPRVFNHTPYHTDLLAKWWVRACQRMGADPDGVVVKFTLTRSRLNTGWVQHTSETCPGPEVEWCVGRRKTMGVPESWKARTHWPRVESNGAWVNIILPRPGSIRKPSVDLVGDRDDIALRQASDTERTLLHEAVHVADDQRDGLEFASRSHGGKRGRWVARPEEIRAMDASRLEWEERERGKREDDNLVLEFAEALRARDMDEVVDKVWLCARCGERLRGRGYRVVRSRRWGRAMITGDVALTAKESWCYDCIPTVYQEVQKEMEAAADLKAARQKAPEV